MPKLTQLSSYRDPNVVFISRYLNNEMGVYVARMGEGRGVHRVLVGKHEGKNHWGDPDIDGRIVLSWISRK